MSGTGDRFYTSEGKRKYVGLHNEMLDRPWTAKKRRLTRRFRAPPRDASISTMTGVSPDLMTPRNPSLLGDIDEMARTFRRVYGQQERIARFTDNDAGQDDAKLQFTKDQVLAVKKDVANTLSGCLVALSNAVTMANHWANEVVDLTLKREDWWEGYNIFSGEIPEGLLDRSLTESPPTCPTAYSRYLIRNLRTTLTGLMRGKLSVQRRTAFVWRACTELRRLFDMPNSLKDAWEYCITLQADVLLLHPCYLPPECRHYVGGTSNVLLKILNKMKHSSRFRLHNGKKIISCLDLSRAARRLRKAMDAYPCVKHDCTHKHYHGVYNKIIKYAQREVHRRVRIAVETYLPAELVNMVVEASVVAEEVDQPLERDEGELSLYDRHNRLDLNCARGRLNPGTNREWRYDIDDTCGENSDREYDSEDLKPRSERQPSGEVDIGASTSSKEEVNHTDDDSGDDNDEGSMDEDQSNDDHGTDSDEANHNPR